MKTKIRWTVGMRIWAIVSIIALPITIVSGYLIIFAGISISLLDLIFMISVMIFCVSVVVVIDVTNDQTSERFINALVDEVRRRP